MSVVARSSRFRPFLLALLSLWLVCRPAAAQQEWLIGTNKVNLSGMATFERTPGRITFLAVHDNKKPDEPHASLITVDGFGTTEIIPLNWPTDKAPVDLESVVRLPHSADTFLALASKGTLYDIRVNAAAKTVAVLKIFNLPESPGGNTYEGVALTTAPSGGGLTLAWGYRGDGAKPGVLYWQRFSVDSGPTGPIQSAEIKVPYPTANVRHLADLRIDSAGIVYVVGASDPGDDGPFSSALYAIGTLGEKGFVPTADPAPLRRFPHHKVEAFEMLPGADGGFIFGTDDENLGTWLLRD